MARGGRGKKKAGSSRQSLELIALGGVNEIGKNMFVLETRDEILIIDCGMAFPGEGQLGVDCLIPDFSYLEKRRNKIVGMVLTHGHEDHVGGLPFFPSEIEIPVYGTPITCAFAEGKMKNVGRAGEIDFIEMEAGDIFDAGSDFEVEPFHVNHSMPDCVGFAIRTPSGMYVHSGDFKIDQTPVDNRPIDFGRLSALGDEGVAFLTVDVTNVDRPGYTPSERSVGRGFREILDTYQDRRIFIAMFSSNVHRIQQAVDTGVHFGRVTAPVGRSMIQSVHISLELGYLKVPGDAIIDMDNIGRLPDGKVLVVATGTQGEPMSALRRMSQGAHKVDIREDDVVVVSARPIPGNEAAVWRTINDLCKLGAKVIYQTDDVHVSGHASREEIKMMCNALKPRWVMPFHGEPRHVAAFRDIVKDLSIKDDAFVQPELGRRLGIGPRKAKRGTRVASGMRLVDGLLVEWEGTDLLEQRKKLSEGGVLVINILVNSKTRKFVSANITSSGFISPPDDPIFERVEQILNDSLKTVKENDFVEYSTYRKKVDEKISKFVWRNTNRSPGILTNVIEV